ncbi:hypothetical protein BV25DRAFT_1818329 [Artomyces pyxidatus]|uniref:Uncharacterized protein n=1 Tax=Artomyces pyxidatus TaxID=48021 RepID=A0ACB8THW2_9AGAM|nr:hypothetical protein BV25DRAFT_1818329 [Artomyces pyxidatus]
MEYRAECHKLTGDMMKPMPYWSDHMHNDVVHHDQIDPGTYPLPEGERTQICSKTITYMLDGHVGLLADLALMAQVAGLAREVKRTFLVDDTYWNRGKWTDHFQDVRARQPGPEPGCRAPPPEELVACPRTARHWVVNSRTAKYHFGHGFFNEFEDPYAREINRLKPIYARARESLTKTLRPNAANAALISSARVEFDSLLPPTPPTPPGATPRDPGRYISVHIRRGDLNGTSWKYHSQHVATREYSAGISDSWDRLFLNGSSPAEKASLTPVVYLASDSPSVVSELRPLLKPGSTVFSLSQSRSPALRELASPGEYIQHEFNGLPAEDRVRLTRGMVVDFAMLSGFWAWDDEVKPGAVVCAIGSNICKMSAVGLEWNRAFGHGFKDNQDGEIDEQHKRWVEVDQKGAVEPVWEAFEVFQ